MGKPISIEELLKRIPSHLTLKVETYQGVTKPATFIDSEYGEFTDVFRYVVLQRKVHPNRKRAAKLARPRRGMTVDDVRKRLPEHLTLVAETYIGWRHLATFIDSEYGEFTGTAVSVCMGKKTHPDRNKAAKKASGLKRSLSGSHRKPYITAQDVQAKLPAHVKIKPETFTGTKNKAIFIDEDYGEFEAIVGEVIYGTKMHPERLKIARRMYRPVPIEELQKRLRPGVKIIPETYTKVTDRAIFEENGKRWEALVYNVLNSNTRHTFDGRNSPRLEENLVKDLASQGLAFERSKKVIKQGDGYPLEIDLYNKELNLGIEIHGLHWHCDARPKFDKYKHRRKQELATSQGIRLLQFFEDEVNFKRDLVMSLIKTKAGMIENRIKAKDCEVRQVKGSECAAFLDKNHLQGFCVQTAGWALYYNGEMVQVLTLRKNKKFGLEIARFATAIGYKVDFGFSRLFKRALEYAKTGGYQSILSYADTRISDGKVYESNGFELDGITVPDMFWTDKIKRYSRQISWSKEGKAKVAKMYRIYGCGHKRYIYKIR